MNLRCLLRRISSHVAIFLLGALVLFLAIDLIAGRSLPPLEPWHELSLENEFRAGMDDGSFGWKQWLELEERLFDELERLKPELYQAAGFEESRFRPGGNRLARRLERDWNRSFVLEAERPRAVALLIHGLSDSPYSLRSLALSLQRAGVTVYGLRLPGHGTLPGELDDVSWQDWLAAVQVATRHIEIAHGDLPFWIVGYSMGAALGVRHTLGTLLRGEGVTPEGLFLISPALGVNPLARLANLQRIFSRFPYFRRSRWLNILPEYDPFKYLSFTKNAGRQMSLLIGEIYEDLDRLKAQGREKELPPILGFQSVVDETVSTVDLVDRLYGVIDDPRSELVLFDINRISFYRAFTRFSPDAVIASLRALGHRNFQTTVITNVTPSSPRVGAFSWSATGESPEVHELKLSWPEEIYSLSHVALPFPPHDPVYGYTDRDRDGRPWVTLGNLAVRGERNVLQVPAGELLRLRANPFYSYLERRILSRMNPEGGEP